MKKKLAAAAAAIVLTLGMSGCVLDDMLKELDSSLETEASSEQAIYVQDSTADDTSSAAEESSGSESKPETSQAPQDSSAAEPSDTFDEDIDDTRFIANARAVVSSWFGLMSAAQYTDAFKLCTEDFVRTNYPGGFTDGEDASPASVSYYDDTEVFDTDELGRRRVRLRICITPEANVASAMPDGYSFDGYMFVVISNGQFLISGASDIDADDSFEPGLSEQDIYLYARLTFDSANVYKDMVEPGVYRTGDGSYLDGVLPEYVPGGSYVIYYGALGVESVEYTADGITVTYP